MPILQLYHFENHSFLDFLLSEEEDKVVHDEVEPAQ